MPPRGNLNYTWQLRIIHITKKKKNQNPRIKVTGFQISSKSIFVWFIPSRGWNPGLFLNIYYNLSPYRLPQPTAAPSPLSQASVHVLMPTGHFFTSFLISEHDRAQTNCAGSVLDGSSFCVVTWCSLSLSLTLIKSKCLCMSLSDFNHKVSSVHCDDR